MDIEVMKLSSNTQETRPLRSRFEDDQINDFSCTRNLYYLQALNNISTWSQRISILLNHLPTTLSAAAWLFLSDYFNPHDRTQLLPDQYNLILNSAHRVTASPRGNGFFNSGRFSGFLPAINQLFFKPWAALPKVLISVRENSKKEWQAS